MYNDNDLLSPAELIAYLDNKICVQTLYKWRKEGKGPAWKKIGLKKVFYLFSDIKHLK